jgi:addiction module RelE/StbE family toxin
MVKIKWSKNSQNDLKTIYQYISNDSILYATRLVDRIVLTVETLAHFPLSGRMVPERNDETIRELIEGNYRIFYKIQSTKQVAILRIHHSARNIK